MRHQIFADLPVSNQDAQDAFRQSRLTEQLAQILAVNRGFRRQLQDHRAAGEQRRKELCQSDLMWRVPRDDSGDHAYRIAVSSTKSVTGHCFGAAGAVEALMCVLAIHQGVIPPTMNYETPDPECDLDYVPNEARRVHVDVALSNAMGLGGHNGCVLLGRYNGGM